MSRAGNKQVVITATTAISPVGFTVEQTCASIRAGVARFAEHAFYESIPYDPESDEGEPLLASPVATIDPDLEGPERLLALAMPPLAEVLINGQLKRKELPNGGLFLALPESDEVTRTWDLENRFISELCARTGLQSFKITKTNQVGHTGMFSLINEAVGLLHADEIGYCIVGGIESYLMNERVQLLDEAWRLKSQRNVDGFVPGEAGVILLLETVDHAEARQVPARATISDIGFGRETQTFSSDKSSSGKGLAQAFKGALSAESENGKVRWVICDLNGENYRAFEWGIILTRLGRQFANLEKLVHPADCVGDVGAASAGLFIAMAEQALARNYGTGDRPLIWCSSNNGERAACLVKRPD